MSRPRLMGLMEPRRLWMVTRKKLLRLAIITPLLWEGLLLIGLGIFSPVIAGAQTSEAQVDSLTSAYYLLQFDMDLLQSRHDAVVKADSLQMALVVQTYESRLDFEQAKRKHTYLTIFVTAMMTGTLAYLLRTLD